VAFSEVIFLKKAKWYGLSAMAMKLPFFRAKIFHLDWTHYYLV
jgi:hypothetical protein